MCVYTTLPVAYDSRQMEQEALAPVPQFATSAFLKTITLYLYCSPVPLSSDPCVWVMPLSLKHKLQLRQRVRVTSKLRRLLTLKPESTFG